MATSEQLVLFVLLGVRHGAVSGVSVATVQLCGGMLHSHADSAG